MNNYYRKVSKEMMERLKKKGVRLTPQRLAVIEFLKKSKGHPSVGEIYYAIKRKYPSISPATVYSTLQMLKEMGEIQELHIRADKASFDNNPQPHHHFLCRICGIIMDVEVECPIRNKKTISGHEVEAVKAYLFGVCSECLKQGSGAKESS